MTDTALLTGQDVGEAEGAMTALLERTIAPSGRSRAEYITLRVLAVRAPFESTAELTDFLAGQRQLGLDRAAIVTMLDNLRAEGLVTEAGVGLTATGHALLEELATAVAPVTREIFADLDPKDLAVAHRVLVELVQRARTITNAV
ncbi:MAG: MarR family winged helix-turn-helix transcriptional regulator [Nocardioidaceae bacterium]